MLCKNEIAVPLKAINKSDCNEFKKSLDNLQNEMYSFIDNTLYYMKKKRLNYFILLNFLLDIAIANRPVVLVTRGEYYIEDLIKLKDFIKKNNLY